MKIFLGEGGEGSEWSEGGEGVANCPAAFLSYCHCGFVMKYNTKITMIIL